MERMSQRGSDGVREFMEFAIVIWFVVTVTGLLIAGVVRYAAEEPGETGTRGSRRPSNGAGGGPWHMRRSMSLGLRFRGAPR